MKISKAINILILVLIQLNVYGLTNHFNFTQSDGKEFNINKNIVSFNIIKDNNNLYDLNFSQDKLDEQLSQPDNSSTFAITPGITPVDPGTGSGSTPTNTSFSSAYELTLNNFIGLYVSAGTAQYFKIQRNQLDYISLYTQGNYDTRVIIYDENYNMIDMNDDVENNNYYNGIHNTTNPNFILYIRNNCY